MVVARLEQHILLPRSLPRTAQRVQSRWRYAFPWLSILQSSSETPGNPGRSAVRSPSLDYERFILLHQRQILNYLWRMTGDRESAFDLTQEVLLRAWQRFEVIQDYDQPLHWLFRVATNLAL